jgi:cupin domain
MNAIFSGKIPFVPVNYLPESIEDETFHVLEGRVAFLVNGEWHEVGPGDAAFMSHASFTRSRMFAISRLAC